MCPYSKPENCHLARLTQHYDMKAVAVTGTIMFRKTENRPKHGFKKVNCGINTSNYKCNQDLHVIVGMQFFSFSFHSVSCCVLNIKLQDQFWKVSFVKRVSRTPLGNRIEEFKFTLKILPARSAHYQNYINWQNIVKVNCLSISTCKCNQDLHVIVGMQFFFQFPFCLKCQVTRPVTRESLELH